MTELSAVFASNSRDATRRWTCEAWHRGYLALTHQMESNTSKSDFGPVASLASLEQRAALLCKLREFFYTRNFVEVETPLLADEVIPELHIEPTRSDDGFFLQASPELHMKRLLAAGATAIFQVTRSFRFGERGTLHNPEFTICEWYRVGNDMNAGIDLLDKLVQSLLGTPPALRTTYAAAFERTLQLCPHRATIAELNEAAKAASVDATSIGDRNDRDAWLNLLMASVVEPQLGRDCPEIIFHYPASQASLSRVVESPAGYVVAERFEVYYRGIELANGFHELSDAAEQRCRFDAVNAARVADGRAALPIPESLLAAMRHGLPDCTGVALGFDRLAMLAIGAESIDDVTAFPYSKS
jgi:lysyl-tRNA synthetase class 2